MAAPCAKRSSLPSSTTGDSLLEWVQQRRRTVVRDRIQVDVGATIEGKDLSPALLRVHHDDSFGADSVLLKDSVDLLPQTLLRVKRRPSRAERVEQQNRIGNLGQYLRPGMAQFGDDLEVVGSRDEDQPAGGDSQALARNAARVAGRRVGQIETDAGAFDGQNPLGEVGGNIQARGDRFPQQKTVDVALSGSDGAAEVDALHPCHTVVGQVGREVAAGSDVVAKTNISRSSARIAATLPFTVSGRTVRLPAMRLARRSIGLASLRCT